MHAGGGPVAARLGLQRRPHGRRGGTRAAGLLAGGLEQDHPGVGVALGELRGTAVGQRHRADLDLYSPGDHLAVELVHGGAGHARRDLLHVEQHVPGPFGRDGDGEGVVHLHGHGASLSLAGFNQ